MDLEPVVVQSIRRERSRSRAQIWLALGTPILVLVLSVALVVVLFLSGALEKEPDNTSAVVIIIAIGLTVITEWLLSYFLAIEPAKAWSKTAIVYSSDYEWSDMSFKRYASALEQVAIAAGVDPPPLIRLTISNASFGICRLNSGRRHPFGADRKHPSYFVIVTDALLGTKLVNQEVEALMADALAHGLIGRKDEWQLSMTAVGLSFFAGLAAIFAGFFFSMAFGPAGLVVAVAAAIGASYISLSLNSKFAEMRAHDSILADSVAARITGYPGYLRTALETLWEAGILDDVKRVSREMFGIPITDPSNPRWTVSTASLDSEDLLERIHNLEEIELGHWKVFESVTDGRVKLLSRAWE
ncbi:MAG: hypothetical protein KKF41_02990 [Actinobacteria bacterium]|nr:hypothetical protein [Actinomycetota bacterium]MBU1943347.1 hypothetical protein [Actinomycetota bacterium]MBU2686535.1 hypothetical protein [Actinomycetota bacterium]